MKINNFNCLSLFDGISACQQAFKNLGIEFDGVNNQYFASEIDRYAIQVTQKNFPNTIQLGDVKKINYNKKDKILYYESDE
jgi:site-specific DNA-cytosine methylase